MSAWRAKGKRKHGSQHVSTNKSQQLKKPKCQDQMGVPSNSAAKQFTHQAEKQQGATSSQPNQPADVEHGHDKTVSSQSDQKKRGLSSRRAAQSRSTTVSPTNHAAKQQSTEAQPAAAWHSGSDSESDDFRPVQRGRASAPLAQPQGRKRHKASDAGATVQGAADKDTIAGQVYLQWNWHTRQWDQQIIGTFCPGKVWNLELCEHGCCLGCKLISYNARWDK